MRINKFRIKIFLLITVSLVIPVLLCCIILFTTTEGTVKKYASSNMASTLSANVKNVEAKLNVLHSTSTSLLINLAKISEVTNHKDIPPLLIFRNTQYPFTVQSSLIVDTYTISGFNYYYLYFPKKSLLLVSRMSFFENVNTNTLDCLFIPDNEWGISTPYNNLISNPILGKFMTEKNFSRNYRFGSDSEEDIVLTVNVKEQYINNLLASGFQFKPNYVIIVDSHGNLLSSLNKKELGHSVSIYNQMVSSIKQSVPNEYLEVNIDGKSYMLNWEYSPQNDWYYITALDVNAVTRSISAILNTMFIMLLILLVLSLSITVLLVRSTTSPLNELTYAMTEIKNKNFKVQLNVNYGDEFEVIYNGFNEMAKEIDSLVHTITQEKNTKTETYIRLLQSEINPHMLYNALESLYSIAKINKQEEIATLVMALSKFFRISLSGGKRVVPFRDAFELANQYIIVQNIRMNYKITFEYDIPEDLMNILTPKFLLQPIVENAFQYGFKNRRGACYLFIKAYSEGECAKIIVQDNGIGIHEQDLNLINEQINDFNFDEKITKKGYALRNINYQIKLKFGNEYGLWLESVYGEYTRVNIKIPKLTEEE